jgi:hypothetical protein
MPAHRFERPPSTLCRGKAGLVVVVQRCPSFEDRQRQSRIRDRCLCAAYCGPEVFKCLHGAVGGSILFSPSLASVRLVDAREDPGPKGSLVQVMSSDGLRLYAGRDGGQSQCSAG